jgi:hypothetical protein
VPIPPDSPYRSLLVDAIDFAGLFPPAAQEMSSAVQDYGRYRQGDEAWALGRFVVPATRLAEFAAAAAPVLASGQPVWLLTVTCGDDAAAEADRIAWLPELLPPERARVDTVEFKARTTDQLLEALAVYPSRLHRFAELPLGEDPHPFVSALKLRGAGAKFRTGGVTTDAFPRAEDLLRAIDAVVRAGVPFKCTAGLHHPVRGEYHLTYVQGGPSGTMYGYLNIFLAAAALMQGEGHEAARRILLEEDPAAFAVRGDQVHWRTLVFDRTLLRALRRRGMRSFGSCSFREPLDELVPLAIP